MLILGTGSLGSSNATLASTLGGLTSLLDFDNFAQNPWDIEDNEVRRIDDGTDITPWGSTEDGYWRQPSIGQRPLEGNASWYTGSSGTFKHFENPSTAQFWGPSGVMLCCAFHLDSLNTDLSGVDIVSNEAICGSTTGRVLFYLRSSGVFGLAQGDSNTHIWTVVEHNYFTTFTPTTPAWHTFAFLHHKGDDSIHVKANDGAWTDYASVGFTIKSAVATLMRSHGTGATIHGGARHWMTRDISGTVVAEKATAEAVLADYIVHIGALGGD